MVAERGSAMEIFHWPTRTAAVLYNSAICPTDSSAEEEEETTRVRDERNDLQMEGATLSVILSVIWSVPFL